MANPNWTPGNSGNPSGRPKGSQNEVASEIKQAFAQLLQNNVPQLEEWINRVGERDPAKALEIYTKISERFVPQLSRQEITGAEGKDLFQSVSFNFITADEPDTDTEQLPTLQLPKQDPDGYTQYEG
jgi:hypothetical protein